MRTELFTHYGKSDSKLCCTNVAQIILRGQLFKTGLALMTLG